MDDQFRHKGGEIWHTKTLNLPCDKLLRKVERGFVARFSSNSQLVTQKMLSSWIHSKQINRSNWSSSGSFSGLILLICGMADPAASSDRCWVAYDASSLTYPEKSRFWPTGIDSTLESVIDRHKLSLSTILKFGDRLMNTTPTWLARHQIVTDIHWEPGKQCPGYGKIWENQPEAIGFK